MLNKSMVSDLLRTYKADKAIRKYFENPEVGRFEKSLDVIFYAVENGKKWLVVPQGKLRQALMHGAHDAFGSGAPGFQQGIRAPEAGCYLAGNV
jgi:hypothetical protein